MMILKSLFLVFLITISMLYASTGHGYVDKSQRELLVISNLETFGRAKYQWLYRFLDASSITMAHRLLGNQYKSMYALPPTAATATNFIYALKQMTNRPENKAVDLIVSLHGSPNWLTFKDGPIFMSDIQKDLLGLSNNDKLRLVYNTACHGSTHSDEFIKGGFKTAVGSLKVNTTSASEYPVFLTRFALGSTVRSILAQTNNDPALYATDYAASLLGFSTPNSFKLLSGRKDLKITDNP